MYSKLNTFSVLLLTALTTPNLYAGTVGSKEKEPAPPGYSFSVTPIYGAISDEGIRKLLIAKTVAGAGGDNTTFVKTHFPDNDSNWGIAASVGYRFNPFNDLVLSYAYLSTKGQRNVYNTTTDGTLANTLSQIVGFASQELRGAAVASVKTKFSYQTGDLITRRLFSTPNFESMQFSRFFGIKAAYFTKRFDATYAGSIPNVGAPDPLRDGINYEAKYYGIGPRIGMGGRWFFNRYISLGGDLSASLLVGAYNNEWRETLITGFPQGQFSINSNTYRFNQRTDYSVWVAPVLAGNLSVAGNFDAPNNSIFQIEGGIGSEQYLPQLSADNYSHPNDVNKLHINQHFVIRSIFIKLSYFC